MDRHKTPTYKNKQRTTETRLFLTVTLIVAVAVLLVVLKTLSGLFGSLSDELSQLDSNSGAGNITAATS